jgi:flagellar motor switch protein FliN/FliY
MQSISVHEISRGLNVFTQDWCEAFSQVCEMVAGVKPALTWTDNESPSTPKLDSIDGYFWWNHAIAGEKKQYPVWVGTPEPTWSKIIAAIESADAEQAKEAYADILSQALTAVAQEIATRRRTKLTVPSAQSGEPSRPEDLVFRTIRIATGDEELPDMIVGVDSDFVSDLSIVSSPRADQSTPDRSNAVFGSLIDIQLPVSVVLGRTTLPIREVLKITSGSLVELGHMVGDPVELVVENAVVARGEVVAVRGNYGIRIHQLISRQERMLLSTSTVEATATGVGN